MTVVRQSDKPDGHTEDGHSRAGGGFPAARLRPLERSADAPLWLQVKTALTEMIVLERLPEHARLPSEAELCSAFDVSRTVVREALLQMVSEGMIYRLQGKGAFVSAAREAHGFAGSVVGFSGELQDKGRRVTRRMLRQEICEPHPRSRRLLQLEADEQVVAVDRVLSVDGVPRAIVRWGMPAGEVPGLETMPLENRSLYETIGRQYGVRFARAERWIEAVSLAAPDSDMLEVAEGHAALLIESVAFSPDRDPIEYYTAIYLTDRSRLHFVVTQRI